ASTAGHTGSGEDDGRCRSPPRIHPDRATRRARDHRDAADDRGAALLLQRGPLEGGRAQGEPLPAARRDRQVLLRPRQVPGLHRDARQRALPALRSDGPHHRQRRDVGGGRAYRSAEGRCVRREERGGGEGHGRNGIRDMVMRRAAGFTYLTILFVVAFMGIGLALVGEVWHTAAVREREADLLFVGNQYRRAIQHYFETAQIEPKRYPASLKELLKDDRFASTTRHLRSLYPDPITGGA